VTDDTVRVLLLLVQEDDKWGVCMVTDAYHPSEPGTRIIAVDSFDQEKAIVFRFPEDKAFKLAEDFVADNLLPFKGVQETYVIAPPRDSITAMDEWADAVLRVALRDLFGVNIAASKISPPGGWGYSGGPPTGSPYSPYLHPRPGEPLSEPSETLRVRILIS
jgi:hypothetical protein